MKVCLTKEPPYADLGDEHISACWLHFMGEEGEKALAEAKAKAEAEAQAAEVKADAEETEQEVSES